MIKKLTAVLFTVLLACLAFTAFILLGGCAGDLAANSKKQTFGKTKDIIEDVFHDQADIYMDPVEPTSEDDVTIRLRVPRGSLTDAVIEFSIDVEKTLTADHAWVSAQMYFESSDATGYYDYWVGIIPHQGTAFRYHFKLTNKLETVYYNSSADVSPDVPFASAAADFYVLPDYSTPDWAKGAVWYSMMPDSFYNGDLTNDKLTSLEVKQNPWGNAHFGGNDYFGGDLAGVSEKIGYLKWLGADSVFMNPIWLTTHQAGYGSFDLTQIDSAFGNDAIFKALVEKLHENDMRVMLDGVFQYLHSSSILLNNGNLFPLRGQTSQRDPLYNAVMRDKNGNIITSEWGQPYFDFSKKATRDYIYAAQNSVMQLYLREYGIDGWRMDVGNTLKGSDPNNWGTAQQILDDMRGYVKDANSDALFLSEHAGLGFFTAGSLDSKWNYDYGYAVRDWAANKKNQMLLEQELFNGVVKMPRAAANASYNFLTTHDLSRIALNAGDAVRTRAAQILTMTYVGAPCIFFGDEVGMLGRNNPGVSEMAPTGFSSMNWNASEWDWEMLNLTRALTQLRKDYASVYKDGLYKTLLVDLKQNLFGFGRWNGEHKTITVTNQNANIVAGVVLDAKQLSIPDGTVLTDYLSGRAYTVKDGKAVVDVMPAGSVFVDGGAGNFTHLYEKFAIGGQSGTIVRSDLHKFTLTGEGSLKGKSDALLLNGVPVFNNAVIHGVAYEQKGTIAFLFRAGTDADAAFYAVTVEQGGALKVLARDKKGNEVKTLASSANVFGKEISLVRGSDNVFTVSVAGKIVTGSECIVEMPYAAYAGFAGLDGTGELSFAVEKAQPQLYADFEKSLGSMLTPADGVLASDGKLRVTDAEAVTQAPYTDFSVRTKLISSPAGDGDHAGLTVQSENGKYAVVFGRFRTGETVRLVLAYFVNGKYSVVGTAADAAGDVFLQLQKSGVSYTALYSSDGETWTKIGQDELYVNFSDIRAGVVAKGSAQFDFFGFGDCTAAGKGYGDHIWYGNVDYSSAAANTGIKYRVSGGTWSYCTGGIEQTQATANSAFYVAESSFTAFKGDFTIGIGAMGENGAVGFAFGNRSEGKIDENAFKFSLTATGAYKFARGGTEYAQGTIQGFDADKAWRFVLCVSKSGMVDIYVGDTPALLVSVKTDHSGGYVSLFGENAAYSVTSFNFFHMGSTVLTGQGEVLVTNQAVTLNSVGTGYAYTALTGTPVTDAIIGANVQMSKANSIARAEIGFLFGTNAGKTPQDGGLYVSVNDRGAVAVREGGKTLASATVQAMNAESFYLIVAVQNKTVSVYVDQWQEEQTWSQEPVLRYEDDRVRGGSIGIYNEQSRVLLDNLRIYGLRKGEDYKTCDAWLDRCISEPPAPEPEVGVEFVTEDLAFLINGREEMARFNKYSGMVSYVKDGEDHAMKIDGTGNWNAGAAIAAGKFENFELRYKMKTEAGGWGAVILNKSTYNYNHETTGLMFYGNTPGNGQAITCYTGGNGGEKVILNDLDLTESYLDVVIRAFGGKLYISCGGKEAVYDIAHEEKNNRKDALSGYISFNAGNCVAYFKDISVRILHEDGSYKNA